MRSPLRWLSPRTLTCVAVLSLLLAGPPVLASPLTSMDDVSAAVVMSQADPPDVPAVDEAPAPDAEVAVVLKALGAAFAADGSVRWIVAAPGIVLLLLLFLRSRFAAPLLPARLGDWVRSRAGGLILGALTAVAIAVIDLGLTGGALSATALVGVILKALWAWVPAAGVHSLAKNSLQAVTANGDAAAAAVSSGDQAHARLEKLGRGPHP